MFDILGEIFGWLFIYCGAGLWCWLTEERALAHQAHADAPDMASIRLFARIFLGLWLAMALAAAIHWFDFWSDAYRNIALAVAGFLAGPSLMVWGTGLWRDRVVARLGKGG